MRLLIGFMLLAGEAAAQWQLGGAIGYGIYRNGTVIAPNAKATAGIRNRFVAGAVVGEDMYDHISGEVRYTYHDGDPFLASGGQSVLVQGQSHAFHYDVLFQARPRGARVRPYVATGAGLKLYVATGPPPAAQPLSRIAVLTTRDDAEFLVSLGGGVQWRLGERLIARFDVRDYLTKFPKKLIAPAPLNTARGILQTFTPMFGLSYGF